MDGKGAYDTCRCRVSYPWRNRRCQDCHSTRTWLREHLVPPNPDGCSDLLRNQDFVSTADRNRPRDDRGFAGPLFGTEIPDVASGWRHYRGDDVSRRVWGGCFRRREFRFYAGAFSSRHEQCIKLKLFVGVWKLVW